MVNKGNVNAFPFSPRVYFVVSLCIIVGIGASQVAKRPSDVVVVVGLCSGLRGDRVCVPLFYI